MSKTDLLIGIPTLGRAHHQLTYQQLESAGYKPVLFVDDDEDADYGDMRTIRVRAQNISDKRQRIMEWAGNRKVLQADDDLIISTVKHVPNPKHPDRTKCLIKRATNRDIVRMVNRLSKLLDKYAHGGVHVRHYVNFADYPQLINKRYYRQMMAFNPSKFIEPIDYEPTWNTGEDIRFKIKLLEQGLDYFILTNFCYHEDEPEDYERWSTEEKMRDMQDLFNRYPTRTLKDGRKSVLYHRIIKEAKRAQANKQQK